VCTKFRWLPCSTVNSPDGVSSVVFFEGCNLRCPFCYNGSIVIPHEDDNDGRLSIGEVLGLISGLSSTNDNTNVAFLESDWLVLSGGEALLDSMSSRVIAIHAKQVGLKVKVNTNGTFPLALSILNDGVVDYFALDFKTPLDRYDLLFGRKLFPYEKECFIDDYKNTLQVLKNNFENACEVNTVLVRQLIDSDAISDMACTLNDAFGINGFYPKWNLHKYEYSKDMPSIDPSYNVSTSLFLPHDMKELWEIAKATYRGKVELFQ